MNSFFERRYVIAGIFIALILVLLGRLFYMQIIDDRYLLFAQNNVLRRVYTNPARGPILDRNKKILVENRTFYDVLVIPKQVKPFDTTEFCKLLNITKDDFNKQLEKAVKYSPNLSSIFEKQLPPQVHAAFQERLSEFPGFYSSPRYLRSYPDSVAAQFLGYISEVTENDIKKSNDYYHNGDFIGVSGVERSYENVLKGHRGVENQLVDSRNRQKGSYANGAYDTAAVAGERLISSLDIRIQKLGEKLMQNKVGSIVAIEPSTGEILCYVSSPTYNPNSMVGHDRGNNAAEMYKDPYKPFFVRPIQASYMPGSSFKPLSALIAMQEGIITPQTTYFCPGYYQAGNRRVKCFHGERHGTVNLTSAIAESCNGYFDMVFEKLMNYYGVKQTSSTFTNWRTNVTKFGLGGRLGLDMPGEGKGYLPTTAHYDKVYRPGSWRSSTIISLAIGQGELLATPLQLANIECTIANHGFFYKPHLIKAIGDKDVIRSEYTVKNYVGIDGQYFEPVIDGMQAVVDHGTAQLSKIAGITMCGKTGTSQNNHGEDHSVFVAFAPRENPKIAIAVIVENSGEGSRWAAPIASFIVEKYLRDSISSRASGATPESIASANRLPDLDSYDKSKGKATPTPKDSLKKSAKDTADKKARIKSTSPKGKKNTQPKMVAALLERREDDQ